MSDTVFVDTSALLSLANRDDRWHRDAHAWIASNDAPLVTHSWIMVEAISLIHRRVGATAAHDLAQGMAVGVDVTDVDAALRDHAVARYTTSPTGISLVDATSFVFMESIGCTRAFTFDRHFADAGFDLVPDVG